MTGHKQELRPGVWRPRVSAGKDPTTGKYIYASKAVEGGQRIADRALAELVTKVASGQADVTGTLFSELLVR